MITKAYYLRNEQEDAEGRMAKWDFKPNWRELMDAGEDTKRGYVVGDALVLVNHEGEVFETATDDVAFSHSQIAERMFSLFNRKGFGEEREFPGPSMSTGDLVALVCVPTEPGELIKLGVTLLQVADCGFIPATLTPEVKALLNA